MDTLSRLSHDADGDVSQAAILGLGLLGAGTNNARLAGLLRGLSSYHCKDPAALFLVRVAQGFAHMGKGLLGLSPYHTDRQLLSGARARARARLQGGGGEGRGEEGWGRGTLLGRGRCRHRFSAAHPPLPAIIPLQNKTPKTPHKTRSVRAVGAAGAAVPRAGPAGDGRRQTPDAAVLRRHRHAPPNADDRGRGACV